MPYYQSSASVEARCDRRCSSCGKEWPARAIGSAVGETRFGSRGDSSGAQASAYAQARLTAESLLRHAGHSCPFCDGLSTAAMQVLFPHGLTAGLLAVYRRAVLNRLARSLAGTIAVVVLATMAVRLEDRLGRASGLLWFASFAAIALTGEQIHHLILAVRCRRSWYDRATTSPQSALGLASRCCRDADGSILASNWISAFCAAEQKKRTQKPEDAFEVDFQRYERGRKVEREIEAEKVGRILRQGHWSQEDMDRVAKFLRESGSQKF